MDVAVGGGAATTTVKPVESLDGASVEVPAKFAVIVSTPDPLGVTEHEAMPEPSVDAEHKALPSVKLIVWPAMLVGGFCEMSDSAAAN